MKELLEYRAELLQTLAQAAQDFRAACLAVKDPDVPLAGGWSVHQIAAHTRDVDRLVYGMRARRTVMEDNPQFPNFDGNAHLAEHYDANEPLAAVLDGFVASITSLVEYLGSLPAEAWSRLSRHTMLGGGLTMQSWVEKGLAHIEEHLESVKAHHQQIGK